MHLPDDPSFLDKWDAYQAEHGLAARHEDFGRAYGLTAKAVKSRIDRARKRRRKEQAAADALAHLDPAVRETLVAGGMHSLRGVPGGWAFLADDDGNKVASVRFAGEQAPDDAETIEDVAERIREALAELPAVEPVAPPAYAPRDLLTFLNVADLHMGMQAYGRETGEDYDTKKALARLADWTGRLYAAAPKSGSIVLVFNGDTFHADDQANVTPRNRHQLDVDTRHHRTAEMAVAAAALAVDQALQHAHEVTVRVQPGNHDPTSYLILVQAMMQRYRNEPRVTVDDAPVPIWHMVYGANLIVAMHGHERRAQQVVPSIPALFREAWGQTRHCYAHTGHHHHLLAQDIHGVELRQARAVAPRSSHEAAAGYPAGSALEAHVYHRERGLMQTHVIAA